MKTKSLFVDTGAFYAKYAATDDCHTEALSLWKSIGEARRPCSTTNFVVAELITLLVYRFGSTNALKAAHEIYSSNFIKIAPITRELEIKALEWLEKYSDQDFSMTDATSFAFMKSHTISTAFTFDHHFRVAGFKQLSLDG